MKIKIKTIFIKNLQSNLEVLFFIYSLTAIAKFYIFVKNYLDIRYNFVIFVLEIK